MWSSARLQIFVGNSCIIVLISGINIFEISLILFNSSTAFLKEPGAVFVSLNFKLTVVCHITTPFNEVLFNTLFLYLIHEY